MAVVSEKLKHLLQPIVESLDCALWGIDLQTGGRAKLLRIYIDKEHDLVAIEDCERVSRQASSVLDVEDVINGEYTLEVSSQVWIVRYMSSHIISGYVGEDISLKLRFPYEGRRNFKGRLVWYRRR